MSNSYIDKTLKENQSTEKAVRDSNARLVGIIESAMDAIITIDEDQHILLFNAAAEQMFGYQADEVLGKPLDILIPHRFRTKHHSHIQRFGETGTTNRSMGHLGTLYGLRRNGSEFPIEASISQVTISNGKLYSVILRDISERKAAEENLRESEQYLRSTFEQAAVGIGHISVEGNWIRANQRFSDIIGYSVDEILTMSVKQITHPDDIDEDVKMQRRVLDNEIQTYTRQKRLFHKDGSIVWVNLTVSLVRDLNGSPKYFIKIYEDITHKKAAEQAINQKNEEIQTMTAQLWQTAKLATMGELAASIAHELNNPLAILSLRIESMMSELEPASDQTRELEIMAQEVDRMASLVGNLLQFSRSNERQISSLDIRDEIERTLDLVHTHMVNRHIQVERYFGNDVPMIQADRQQLRQLFLNLFTNASDAMPQGGTLTITVDAAEDQKQIKLEVRDTGIGIPPDVLPHVANPFYTTKAEGKGTGLGLSICRRIVEEHHGQFYISSPGVNQGTTVQVLLPSGNEAKPIFIEE